VEEKVAAAEPGGIRGDTHTHTHREREVPVLAEVAGTPTEGATSCRLSSCFLGGVDEEAEIEVVEAVVVATAVAGVVAAVAAADVVVAVEEVVAVAVAVAPGALRVVEVAAGAAIVMAVEVLTAVAEAEVVLKGETVLAEPERAGPCVS
jgi:hypothetical protein